MGVASSAEVLLSEKYFEPLAINDVGSNHEELLAFRLKRPAIVLCNEKTGQALASFMWQAHNDYVAKPGTQEPCKESFAQTSIFERDLESDGVQNFHGIVDKNQQFCEYLLTNLTGVFGRPAEHAPHLMFDIYESRTDVFPVRINKVDVIKPGQTIKVYADELRGSQKIILEALVRNDLNSVRHTLSVEEDDAEVVSGAKAKAEGIHYTVKVIPQAGHERTNELFGNGVKLVWRVQDVVLLSVPIASMPTPSRGNHPAEIMRSLTAYDPLTTSGSTVTALSLQPVPLSNLLVPDPAASSESNVFAPTSLSKCARDTSSYDSPKTSIPTERRLEELSPMLKQIELEQMECCQSAAMRRGPSNDETSILRSLAAQVRHGGFANVKSVRSDLTFFDHLRAPLFNISLSVAAVDLMNSPSWSFVRSADDIDSNLRLESDIQFQIQIEVAYQKWIVSIYAVKLRSFSFYDATEKVWFIIDLSTMTGTQSPGIEVLDRHFIDPRQVVPIELRRQNDIDRTHLSTLPIRPLAECILIAQAACVHYKILSGCNGR